MAGKFPSVVGLKKCLINFKTYMKQPSSILKTKYTQGSKLYMFSEIILIYKV